MLKVQKEESVNIQVIAKQRAKREQTHPVCLHAMEKYKKVDSVNTHNDYETVSKN